MNPPKPTKDDLSETIDALTDENLRLRGIIARNAQQRLSDKEAFVPADDIKASLAILYEEQRRSSSNHELAEREETPAPCKSVAELVAESLAKMKQFQSRRAVENENHEKPTDREVERNSRTAR